jgi:hypothetical protein
MSTYHESYLYREPDLDGKLPLNQSLNLWLESHDSPASGHGRLEHFGVYEAAPKLQPEALFGFLISTIPELYPGLL